MMKRIEAGTMTKPINLSNSQVSTYLDCQQKWYLDKVARIRPTYLGSALFFGVLLDNTIEHILLKQEGSYKDTFYKCLNNFEVNGVKKTMPDDLLDIRFFAGDVDADLVDQKHVNDACDRLKIDLIHKKDFLDFCKQQRKNKKKLDDIEQYLFNYMAWVSLEQKGLMLVEKFKEWIEENVAEVHSVQKKIEIENGSGDKFIGFLDFVVTLKTDCGTCGGDGIIDYIPNVHEMGGDYPEFIDCPDCNPKKVLVDLKTSSNPTQYYPADSAAKSMQLGIYSQEEKIPDVAYLVGDKKIRKREPRVRLKFVEGVITEEWLDEVFEVIEGVTEEIKEKLPEGKSAFEKNKDSCMNFGGCQYRGLCEKNSMKGLEKVK
jgi:hypothetical protein